jgi:hypothetical protein
MNPREIEDAVLELLTVTPSSFAALYGYIFRESAMRPSVDDLLGVLNGLESRRWIRCQQQAGDGSIRAPTELDRARARIAYKSWLDQAAPSELSVDAVSLDEVGLLVEIQPAGRSEWSHRAGESSPDRWMLDQDHAARAITIHAADVATAERVLENWLEMNAEIRVRLDSRQVELVSEYRLRDGGLVESGSG